MISVANRLPRQTVVATFLIAAFLGSCNVPGPTAPDESTIASAAGIAEHVHTGDTQGTTYLIKYLGDVRVAQSRIDSVLEDY